MAVGLKEAVLAPRFSRVLCVLVVAACTVVVVSLIAYGRVETLVRYSPGALLVAALAVEVFWRPRIRIGPAEVEVVNPFRTHVLTWPAVVDIDTKWTLTLVTARGRIQVWAAPSPGPLGNVGSHTRDAYGMLSRTASARRVPSSIGDIAATLVLRQWQDYRDRGLLGEVEGDGRTTRTHGAWIVVCAALAALTAAGVLWP